MKLPYIKGCRITNLFGSPPPKGVIYSLGYHTGLDLVGTASKQIVSCEAGKVTGHGYDAKGWGNWVKVKGESGLTAIYCHLAVRSAKAGDMLKAGDIIGTEGKTGQSSGSHLHLEFRQNHDDPKTAIDPCQILGIEKKIGEVVLKVNNANSSPENNSDNQKKFDTVQDLPDWARPAILKLMEKGYLKGDAQGKLGLSQDMMRVLIILDRTGVFG